MSLKQFHEALVRHGMRRTGFLGYVEVGYGTSVSMLNANTANRRQVLAFLLDAQEKARLAAEKSEASHG